MTQFRKNVSQPWFNHILSGQKTIEGRLGKGDFNRMQPHDTIVWASGPVSFQTEITHIARYGSFYNYLISEGLNRTLPDIHSIEEGVAIYRKFFTAADERKYGVVAIHLRIC
jgi:ASC-1-like (ASCH) protein